MVAKKLSQKTKIAYNLLKDDGVLAVGIRSLEYMQKKSRAKGPNHRKHKVDTSAIYSEVIQIHLVQQMLSGRRSQKKVH